MRKFGKEFLFVLCLCLMLGLTACGSRNDMDNQTPTDNNSMNNATENTQGETSTDRNDNMQSTDRNENGGVVDDLGDAVGEGINDIGNGVEDLTDGMTGENNRDNPNR